MLSKRSLKRVLVIFILGIDFQAPDYSMGGAGEALRKGEEVLWDAVYFLKPILKTVSYHAESIDKVMARSGWC